METAYGKVIIEPRDQLFEHIAERIEIAARDTSVAEPTIGLTGGSTPKAFYQWATEQKRFKADALSKVVWSVSDERMVPLEDSESNFGNADRMLLEPLGVAAIKKFPWPVQVDPHSASVVLNRKWLERFGPDRSFELCFLGMGDDGHTASLFPDSPLLGADISDSFSCVEVPGKGWRLTLTEVGICQSKDIVVVVTGSNKAERVKAVFNEPVGSYPIQILKQRANKVTWLMDPDAAKLL
ncbi:MAG: 6-phosphogluconolactonase [Opitutales bacterium]|nr:6-phosphogluconolactonase [Opitutales bacterium]